jgi:AraC-like DNA-binding protein
VCYVAARGLSVRHHAIHALVPMIGFLRRYTGSPMRSISVDLASAEVVEARSMEQVIGLPVRANRDGYRLVFPAEWLRLRRPQDQPRQFVSRRTMIDYYGSQPRLPATTSETVAALLAPFVGDIRFDIDAIAEKLGVSRRTLQMRLGAEGTTFRSVSLAVRMKQAQRLILDSRDPIAQVAVAVGYSDQAHFSRAFVDLHGATPNEFRRRAREHPG